MNHRRVVLLILSVFVLLLGTLPACNTEPPASQMVKIVTTSNIIADWVRQIGGDRVDVFSLMSIGTDPHTFQPGAGDVVQVAEADVIFTVGLGLEGIWLSQLLENAAADPGRVVALGDYIEPITVEEDEHEGGGEHHHGEFDPHFWWDPLRVKNAVNEIAQRLTTVDASGAETYSRNLASYQQELDGLNARIVEATSQIPQERRTLVTSHEMMNYFVERYGFEAVGSVFPGITTESEPSPAELTELIHKIQEFGVPAIFTETIANDRLAQTVASETGVKVVRLYSGSLGPAGSGAETYIGMMDNNVEAIVQALS